MSGLTEHTYFSMEYVKLSTETVSIACVSVWTQSAEASLPDSSQLLPIPEVSPVSSCLSHLTGPLKDISLMIPG